MRAIRDLANAPEGTEAGLAWGETLKLRARIEEKGGPVGKTLTARRLDLLELGQPTEARTDALMLLGYPAPYGGVRWWFACPECGQRRRALYHFTASAYVEAYKASGYVVPLRWRCRVCGGLAYASQRLELGERLRYRARKIAARIGKGDVSWHDENRYFPKPKGMHWRTWERHNRELDDVEARRNAVWMLAVAPLLARADKYSRRER